MQNPERNVLKLSDAFENQSKPGCLEVEALMLDVNVGKNKELMKSCRELQEYAAFVGKIKEYIKEYNSLEEAIDLAIDYCIAHDVMKEILLKHRSEVARMIFREFDEVEYRRQMERQMEEQLLQKDKELSQKDEELLQQKEQLSQKDEELLQQKEQLSQKDEQLTESKQEIETYRKILKEHGLLPPEIL